MEIIRPGNLPNHLTVDNIRAGNSVIRNPVLAPFAAKGVLPYRGLGTGIRRARADWPAVDLIDDRNACTCPATVRLTTGRNAPVTGQNAPVTDLQRSMLGLIAGDPSIAYGALGLPRDAVIFGY